MAIEINGYDIPSRRLLGSVVVSNVSGTPTKMIRWGSSGLAIPTSGGQLFLVTSPMVASNSFADVTVSVSGPAASVTNGATVPFYCHRHEPGQLGGGERRRHKHHFKRRTVAFV